MREGVRGAPSSRREVHYALRWSRLKGVDVLEMVVVGDRPRQTTASQASSFFNASGVSDLDERTRQEGQRHCTHQRRCSTL